VEAEAEAEAEALEEVALALLAFPLAEEDFGVDERTDEALVADAAEPVPLAALEEATEPAEPVLVVALLDEEPWWELGIVREYSWDVVDLRSGLKHRWLGLRRG